MSGATSNGSFFTMKLRRIWTPNLPIMNRMHFFLFIRSMPTNVIYLFSQWIYAALNNDSPKTEIMHKFGLIMRIDDCNFLLMLTQIAEMFTCLGDDLIHQLTKTIQIIDSYLCTHTIWMIKRKIRIFYRESSDTLIIFVVTSVAALRPCENGFLCLSTA